MGSASFVVVVECQVVFLCGVFGFVLVGSRALACLRAFRVPWPNLGYESNASNEAASCLHWLATFFFFIKKKTRVVP